jgi:ankyrin repeat protein
MIVEAGSPMDIFILASIGETKDDLQLIQANSSLVKSTAQDGFQLLGLACFLGNHAAVEFLQKCGAKVNAVSENKMHLMPLHSAIAHADLEFVRMLLEHRVQVNARQSDEFTPLHAATHSGQLDSIQILLDFGADPAIMDANGGNALKHGRKSRHLEATELLLEHRQVFTLTKSLQDWILIPTGG